MKPVSSTASDQSTNLPATAPSASAPTATSPPEVAPDRQPYRPLHHETKDAKEASLFRQWEGNRPQARPGPQYRDAQDENAEPEEPEPRWRGGSGIGGSVASRRKAAEAAEEKLRQRIREATQKAANGPSGGKLSLEQQGLRMFADEKARLAREKEEQKRKQEEDEDEVLDCEDDDDADFKEHNEKTKADAEPKSRGQSLLATRPGLTKLAGTGVDRSQQGARQQAAQTADERLRQRILESTGQVPKQVPEERREEVHIHSKAPMVFSQGCMVRLEGLTKAPHLNGCRGIVRHMDPAGSGRYLVEVELRDTGDQEAKLIQPENLVLETASDRAKAAHGAAAFQPPSREEPKAFGWKAARSGGGSGGGGGFGGGHFNAQESWQPQGDLCDYVYTHNRDPRDNEKIWSDALFCKEMEQLLGGEPIPWDEL